MDTSTPAQQEPAQPPSTDRPPPMDSRNDSVPHDESAPLLEADNLSPPTRNTSTKVFYILTSTALSSALTLIFIIAAFIALEVEGNSYGLSWAVSESMKSIIAPVFIPSTLLSNVCSHASGCVLPSLLDVQPRRVTQPPWCSSFHRQYGSSCYQCALRYLGGSRCNFLRSRWSI